MSRMSWRMLSVCCNICAMVTEFERLKEDLLMLPPESRASLARTLIQSLDESVDEQAESLWLEEILRRDAEIRSGTANLKPAQQVLQEARDLIRCLK